MGKVLVHGPGLGFGAGDGDVLSGGIVEQGGASGEAGVEFGDTPGSDDFDGGLESIEGEFEADLVVSWGESVSEGLG